LIGRPCLASVLAVSFQPQARSISPMVKAALMSVSSVH
jgi:hypothetical protein